MKILSALRTELGQLSYSFKARNTPRKWRDQIAAIKGIRTFNLPPVHLYGARTEVWGVSVVKNELDILPNVIEHMFAQGIDRILIADNLSDDGTTEYLQTAAARDPRIIYAHDNYNVHLQSEKMTWLSHLAWRHGARWIVPFDGDEFWYAPEQKLASFLRNSDKSVYYAGFHHTVPTIENPHDIVNTELVMDTADSFPGKVAFRSHPIAVVIPGNHNVHRLGGREHALNIVHLQYRSTTQIARKVRVGTETARRTGEDLGYFAPHWLAGSKLSDAEIAEVWANISSGKPDERIQFKAEGPMAHGKFLRWATWNEDGSLDHLDNINATNGEGT
ncbi:MAG: glycosyltransferase family 2 protein [Rothia sp. (in: high G+C Gram-positive bacteria)]|uniref:glycosyltransferase family 2 protein n=1 Tax=Rothia sp. (in: high G+C Gram-positive bacteria) TaxID=1885016 RepID=UPI0026DC9975|nr:glycosyltransferase family 2 protein [Rothia sp. (in: high G+C Gram-positive bacteria)]MDO4883993.1 glycosyltransferase family 2 protein [Rothia sp. (in: high G+C Gram-positive bacteria)]